MYVNPGKSHDIKPPKGNILSKLFKTIITGEKREMDRMTPIMNQSEEQELLESILSAKKEWLDATVNFEYADDEDIIDYYTYKIKACQVRYEYFLKKAKEKGLRVEALNDEVY